MQPMDEQPLPQSNQSSSDEQQSRDLEQAGNGDLQGTPPGGIPYRSADQPAGGEGSVRGSSEQVLFPTASIPSGAVQPDNAPYQPPSYQPGQGIPPYQPGQPGAPAWNYPPRPEQYQGGAFAQPGAPSGASATQPFHGVAPGQFGQSQPHDAFGQPFHSAATTPFGQPAGGSFAPTSRRSGVRTGTLVVLALLIALVFGTGIFAGWQFGHSGSAISPVSNSGFQAGNKSTVTVPEQTGNNADAVREAVINKVQPGIVQINVVTGSQQALGSGVIIDARGYIVTNNHVVAGASSIQVTLSNNQTFPAQIAGTDAADDLAVIKITPPAGGLTTVNLGDSSQLRVGQEVLAIGSPLGNAETVTNGIVSALNRNVSEGQNGPTLPDAIQTDAPINPGNSGGALVNLQGDLVGMPTLNAVDTEFNTPANGLGFAIPVNRIRYIAQQIITDGRVLHTGRAILGVTVTTVTPTLAAQYHLSTNNGVLIVNVSSGGPAASAGLQANDVIVQLGNTTTNSTTNVSSTLLQKKPGDSIAVKVYRGSQQMTFNVTLGELPAN